MGVRAMVFDMDGTVLHTLPDLTLVTNLTMEKLGYPQYTEDEVMTFVGNGAARLVCQALPATATPEEQAHALALWQQTYLECGDKLTQPFPGIVDVLRAVRSRGVKTAVLSNKFDAAVRLLADEHFPGLFDVVRGEIPPTPRKPDPQVLFQILNQLGVAPAQCAYVGDTGVDAQVAFNAGTLAVGVAWGYDAAIPLPVEKLDAYIHEPRELLELV